MTEPKMGFGLLSFVILFAIVWHKKFCDATPILTLTGESNFKIGDNRTLTCMVNQDVDLLSVSFFKGITETIWISNPSPTSCSFFNLIPDDNSSYSTTCDPFNRTFTMTKYKLDASDNNTAWFCQMKSVPGGNGSCVGTNNSCTSENVTFILSVPVTTLKTRALSNSAQCELESGVGPGHGFGIPIIITVIVVVIFICTAYIYAYTHGLVLGLGIGITFQVSWIIIASLISTGTTSCNLELGLGLCLVLGIICIIICIIAVIFAFFSFSFFEGIPNRVEFGKGILTGLLFASVIGIIVVYLIYDTLKRKPTSTNDEDNQQETDGKNPEQVQLKPIVKNNKTTNSGPPAVHTGTQNKVEPDTISNQTNDRQQPVLQFRPQPPLPKNSEIKDRSLRGISATIGDTLDLASETPRPIKLPPLTAKQETVQEVDASEESKKKRKRRKKKDQVNEKTQEDENGETI